MKKDVEYMLRGFTTQCTCKTYKNRNNGLECIFCRVFTALSAQEAEIERLRKQNHESAELWTRKISKTESDLAVIRNLMQEAKKLLRPEGDGLHFSAFQQAAVAELLLEIQRLKDEVEMKVAVIKAWDATYSTFKSEQSALVSVLTEALTKSEEALSLVRSQHENQGDYYDGFATQTLPVIRAALSHPTLTAHIERRKVEEAVIESARNHRRDYRAETFEKLLDSLAALDRLKEKGGN